MVLRAFALLLGLCAAACGGGTGGTGDGGAGGGGSGGGTGGGGISVQRANPVEVQVLLPAESTLDLGTTRLLSQLDEAPVTAGGLSRGMLGEVGRILSVLLDENDQPLLCGFIWDEPYAVSVASTVEATLYFALGMQRMPEEIRQAFWQEARYFPGYPNLVGEAENLFVEDPAFLGGDAYRLLVEQFLQGLSRGVGLEKVQILDNEVRSGLQLEELPGDRIRAVNNLRRRCFAYIYKLRYTTTAGSETVLIQDVASENAAPQDGVPCGPVGTYESFIGTLQGAAAGSGVTWFRSESNPLDVALGPLEQEAVYSVRVIGPSIYDGMLTDVEKDKLRELGLETLAIDVVLPILFDLADQTDFLKDLKADPDLEALIGLTKDTLSMLPGLVDPISKGEFGQAFRAILDGLLDGTLSSSFEPVFLKTAEYIGKRGGLEGADLDAFVEKADMFNQYLKVTDRILKIYSYVRLIGSVYEADKVEEFEVVTTRGKVTLGPPFSVAIQGSGVTLTAEVQDVELDGGSLEYTWSTSGQYGELRDSLGKSGTSFVSSQNQVEFFSSVGVSLPQGSEAIDVVNVSVALKQLGSVTPIGEKSAAVEVRELGFEITPENAELEGGDTLTLNVQRTDGEDPFASAFFDYKVVWEVGGRFGLFDGRSSSFTSTTSSSVLYVCLEEEDEGVETVTARVYCRPKGSTKPYELVDRAQTTLDIMNDPNTKIFYVPRFTWVKEIAPSLQGGRRFSIIHSFHVPPVEGAERYTIKVVVWRNSTVNYLGRGTSWNANDTSKLDELDPSQFVYHVSTGSQVGEETAAMLIPNYNSVTGLAKVTVTLAPQ